MRGLLCVWILISGLVFSTLPVSAQPGSADTGLITGTVRGANSQQHIQGALVVLVSQAANGGAITPLDSVRTDSAGAFRFDSVAIPVNGGPGGGSVLRVVVSAVGYQLGQGLVNFNGTGEAVVNVLLQPSNVSLRTSSPPSLMSVARSPDGGLRLRYSLSMPGWVQGFTAEGGLLGSLFLPPASGETLLPSWAAKDNVFLTFSDGHTKAILK